MNNKNTDYEKLVAIIHQGMLAYDGFENLRVEHNVTLTGKSGATHQIDVFWEFEAAGTVYRTCVECKNYTSAVKKSHVAAFSAILADIGNANGIIATTSSFQVGAKLLAEQNNIRLVVVNHLLKSIHIKMQPIYSDLRNLQINFNKESIKGALERNNLESYDLRYMLEPDHPLLDAQGKEVETFKSLLDKNQLKEGSNVINDINLYIEFHEIGLLLIDSISLDKVTVHAPPIESVIETAGSERAVIEDIVNNNIHYLHDDGRVTPKNNP